MYPHIGASEVVKSNHSRRLQQARDSSNTRFRLTRDAQLHTFMSTRRSLASAKSTHSQPFVRKVLRYTEYLFLLVTYRIYLHECHLYA